MTHTSIVDRLLIWALWVFVLIALVNGLHMVAMPQDWYQRTPGVAQAGPFNIHFIRDIGFAFLSGTLALVLALTNPSARRPLLLVALVFFGGHAGLHGAEIIMSDHPRAGLGLEIAAIILPALIMLLVFFRTAGVGARSDDVA